MNQTQDNIYRNLAAMFLPNELLDFFEVVGFEEELTGKEIMNGYPDSGTQFSREFAAFLKVFIDSNPVTFKSVGEVYRINPSTLGKAYRDKLSGYSAWDQKAHAEEWILHAENVGEYMSIDETAPSRGDLFTILFNKEGKGLKGTVAAIVNVTKSEDLSATFNRIPLCRRELVKEVTMDFSDSMDAAVTASFLNARHTIDCFHVVQLVTSALSEMRMKHKRKAMKEFPLTRKIPCR